MNTVSFSLSPDFPSITVTNFSSSWYDGRALVALIAVARPDIVSRKNMEVRRRGDRLMRLSYSLSLKETSDARELAIIACKKLSIQSMNESILTTFGMIPDWNKVHYSE